jgi:hypothetical protein
MKKPLSCILNSVTLKRGVIAAIMPLLCVILFSAKAKSQLGVYAFNGSGGCPNGNVNVTTQPANAAFSSFTTINTLCSGAGTSFINNRWNTTNTIDLTEYSQFSITPNGGYVVTLTSLTFKHQTSANATGGTVWVLRSSLDNYASDIATGTATTTLQTATATLPAATFTNIGGVTFRLYLLNANANNTDWGNDDVSLFGTINQLPATPTTPTSNSPQCSNVGVTLSSVAPPAGETWYWQTTATGTSTVNPGTSYTVYSAGIYYLRARNNTSLAWSTSSSNITVAITPDVNTPAFSLGATSMRCQGAGVLTYTATASNTTGITYSLDAASLAAGNTINTTTGDITFDAAWYGISTVTASAAGCAGPKTSSHIINTYTAVTTPVFTNGATSVRCQGAGTVTYTATASNTTGISYSIDAASIASGNSINPATGVLTYAAAWSGTTTITATAAGCSGPTTTTHTVTITATVGTPVFTLGATSTRCQAAGAVFYNATATTTTGITYSIDAASLAGGNTIDAMTGEVTYAAGWFGNTTITASAAGCNGPALATHVVNTMAPVAIPVFNLGGASTICQASGTVTFTASATYATGIVYSLDAASLTGGNTINAATGAVTFNASWIGTTQIIATAAGCYGPQAATHIVTITPSVGVPVFNDGASSTICQASAPITYTASASTTTGITYSLDAASLAGGNTINASTGTVTYAAGWNGTTTITASAAGCNGPSTATHTVTVTATVGVPVFTLGATSNRCQAANAVTYTATATTNTGITYALDALSLAGGNTIDASTGVVTFAAGWFGTSAITATATGCNGPTTATHTVTTNEPVSTPIFTLSATSVRCQGVGSITYDASANHTTGITYTLDAASITGGNTINAATGAVTYTASWSGTSTITASAAGCFGPLTATHTVTITPTVGTPVFTLGATSSRCQAAGNVTYTANATTTTGITYTLDATSLSSGNSINAATGEVTFTAGWFGTSTVTASAAGCNEPKTSTHTITTNAPVTIPVFTAGGTTTRCQGANTVTYTATSNNTSGITYSLDAASLSAGNTINASTGAVAYSAAWTGTSVITATAAGCYGPQTAQHTVTITPTVTTPVFVAGGSSTRCQGAATVPYNASASNTTSITYSLDVASITGGNSINITTGDVTYASTWTGTTVITASAAGCNGPATATHTVTIISTVGTPIFTLGAATTRCQGAGAVTYTANATTNTGIVYSLDATSLANGNTINASTGAVSFVTGWSGSSIITATASGCNGPSIANHTVTITPTVGTPVFTSGSTSIRCQGAGTVSYAATATNTTGITYTLDAGSTTGGNSINASTGVVTWSATWSGTTTVTASAAGCNGPVTSAHNVTITPTVGLPVFTMGATSSRCQAAGNVTYTANATTTTGITYSIDAASSTGGNSINSSTGEVTYAASWTGTTTVTASAAGCNGPRIATHVVTTNAPVAVPVFAAGATTVRCQGAGTVTYNATATATTGITYILDGASITGGNSINATTGVVTYIAGWSGTSTITAGAAGCYGPQTAQHVVTITPTVGLPVFTMGASSVRCQGAAVITYDASATNTTGITYSLNAASITGGNTINAATGAVTYAAGWSGTTTITASAAGCNGPRTATHTVTVTPTVGTPVFTLGATSARCQGAGTTTYTASATNNTGITYALDAANITAGNSINTATGAVTYVAGWFGTSVITATATGCNGPSVSQHTVTTNEPVTTPVFTPGSTSIRCQGAGTVSYAATATNTTGITYSLNAASVTGGNTINATTGAVTWAGTWSGTTTITASAAGCSGPQTSVHTVTITSTVGLPVFGTATSTRCQGANNVTYTATATDNTSITYSLDATSLAGGNTINTATGEVTYQANWSGTSVITATATGCNGPRAASHTVTTNGTVATPIFDDGPDTYRCSASSNVFYRATAVNSTAISYSIDAASISAGLSINSSNGRISYPNPYSGTVVITATASGCSGPTTAVHTARSLGNMGALSFTAGATSSRCPGAGMVTYTANANNAASITYSLNAASLTGGNTIDAATGEVTYASSWNGTTIITATATNCSGTTTTATHTVSSTPSVATPVFTLGATSTRCQGANAVTYTATATNSTSRTYALDATSLSAGNTIVTTTGVVTYVAGWTGTTTITVTAAGCNGPTTAIHTVTTTPSVTTPVFTSGATSTRCQGAGTVTYTATATNATSISYSLDATSVSGGNTINTTTGTVTFAAGWTGATTITASAAGCNGPVTATHVVTVTPTVGVPVFALGASSSRCDLAATIAYTATASNNTGITYSLDAASLSAGNSINPATGNVTYVTGYTGSTTITVSATGCNGPATAIHTVTVTSPVTAPIFTLGATSTRCQGTGSVTYTASASNTTGITYSLDAASITGGNTINTTTGAVTYVAGWNGTTTITASAAGCFGPQTSLHTVTITPTVGVPVFASGATSTRCQAAGTITYTATATNTTGITYSLDAASLTAGNTINASTGAVTYVAGWTGTSTITASAAGCNGPKTSTHVVTMTPTVGTPVFTAGATSTRCQGAGTITYTATASNNTGITYSLDATSTAAGNSINTTTGAVIYVSTWSGTSTITASAAGCNGPATSSHVVTITPTVGTPVFTSGATSTRCQGGGSVTYTATATNSTGMSYSLDAGSLTGGNTINAATGAVTFAAGWTGTTTITASAAGCNGPVTTSHIVTVTPTVGTPVFFAGATSSRCQAAGTITYDATATNNTGYTYSLDAASLAGGNSINAATGAVIFSASWSGTTTITVSAAGCNGPKSASHVVTVNPAVGTPVFTAGATSVRCQGANSVTYSATASASTGITYSLDAVSTSAGNTINAATGAVTYVAGWTGTTTITATAAGCYGPSTASHVVSITPTVGAPVFTLGASSIRCQAAGTNTYSATATNSTGITYSLNAASLAAGNTINAATGLVTFTASWSGPSTVTASAAGCNGPSTAVHTISTSITVGTPVFAAGSTSTICQGTSTITYTATATDNTGLSYSLDAASISAGNTINAATGAVTYVGTWNGTSTITATASGCNGPASSMHTVTITPTVGTPAFISGATTTRCQAAGTVTYGATATNSTGITYALDAGSIGAGNSINTATGAVTYIAGWNGTSIITASATGCNGPVTATHTVTTTPTVGTPVFTAGATSTRCQAAGAVTYGATATNSTSITYSLDGASLIGGNSINPATGAITFAAGWSGNSTITATAAGCNGPKTATHVVTTNKPVATPVFVSGSATTRCQGAGTVSYTATAANTSGITYTLDATSLAGGNTINSLTGAVIYVAGWAGTSTITASAAGCYGPLTDSHVATTTASVSVPVFTSGASSVRCQGAATITYAATATSTTGITYTLDAASITGGNTIIATTGAVTFAAAWTGVTTITASAAGCGGPRTATHTVTVNTTVVTPGFAFGATSTRCQGAGVIRYSASSFNASGIVYSLDAASITAGNSINSATGDVTYAASFAGNLIVTATASGCNGPSAASHTVTVRAAVGTPVFTLGATSSRCQGAGAVTFGATASSASGITYSLDAVSITAGNTIDPSTGTINFLALWSGNSTITATAAGCNGPKTATHVVTTTATVGLVAFTFGPTSNRCQVAGVVNYTATSSSSTSITYSLDAASIAAGNAINTATGTVTYTAGWIGTSTITATAIGCNGSTVGSHVAATNGLLGNATFALGAASTRCRGAGTVIYVASAPNTIGITYTLDAASLAAGNTINKNTGAVAYVITWSGTSVITATAAGCGGPKVVTHTVTITPNTCAVTMIANTVVETIPTGSKIVNMGIVPQTPANGLKPYGLVHELLRNNIPVKWVYSQSKVKDGIDLVHNNVTYRGSAFIILADYLTATTNTILTNWQSQGVIINTTISPFDVEVIHTLKTEPQWVLDNSQTIIGRKLFEDAGIPTTAWSGKDPSQLNNCDDIFVLPHAAANWAEHKNLYYWNKLYKGNLWIGCYAAPDMENLYGPDINNPALTIKMNFLMKDGPALGKVAVPFNKHQNASPPFTLQYSGFPVMQFMGKTDNAHMNGPETIYLPEKGGGWRPTTFIGSYDPSQKNMPTVSDGPAAAIAFGRAFGDDDRGWVMYTSGHHIDGSGAEEIAAQRSFFNFSFFSIREKKPAVTITGLPVAVFGNQTYPLSIFTTSEDINPTFTYQWISSCGGTFSNPTSPSTNFTAPNVAAGTKCLITCRITDNCGRKSFDTRAFSIQPGPRAPIAVSDNATYPGCEGDFVTIYPLANDSDPDGGALTLTLLGNGTSGNFVNNGNGSVTYVPGLAYNGFDQVTYQICNPNGMCATSTIKVSVNQIDANGCGPDQFFTVVGTITALRSTQAGATSAVNKDFSLGAPDGVVGNVSTYTSFGNGNNIVNYTLSGVIPRNDNLWFYVDGSAGAKFTVRESADSTTWTNPIQYTLTGAENFLKASAKAYPATAGTKWIRITVETTTAQIDAMEYFVKSCVSATPSVNDDVTQALEDIPVIIDVAANDVDPQNLPLTVSGIVTQPLTGRVSINMDNTITYINLKDQINGGIDSFAYRSCNTNGICNTATVVVNIAEDGCVAGQYKPGLYNSYTTTLSAVTDSYIWSASPSTNYGSNTSIVVKGKSGDLKRAFLKFDYPGIPSDAIIDSANLSLYMTAGPTTEAISVYRITKGWTEPGINWSSYDGTGLWTFAGGDGDNAVVASSFLTGAVPAYKNWNIRSVVQGWVSGTYPNYGIGMIRNPEGFGTTDIVFRSKEAGTNIPQLYLAYRVPLACTDIPAYAPFAMPDTTATNSVTPITIKVTTNDYDYNNTGVTVALMGATTAKGGVISLAGGSNNIIYTPPTPAFNGVDTFKYKITSGGLSDSACVFVFVRNAPPQALIDSFSMLSNTITTPSTITNQVIVANDADPEGGPLALPVLVKNGKNGIATLSATGTISYTPNINFIGRDTVYYSVEETVGAGCFMLKDTALAIFKVNNRPPVAVANSISVNPCESLIIPVLPNDSDPEEGNMTVQIVTQPAIGTVQLVNNNTEIFYNQPSGISGISTSFTYRACDNANPTLCGNTVTVTINIRPLPPSNNAPVALRDTFNVNLGEVLYADVLTNDYDPDNNDFRLPLEIVTPPVHGAALPMEFGLIQYTPTSTYYGVDSFQYRVYDTLLLNNGCVSVTPASATAWAYIIVQNAPIATWDRTSTGKGIPVTINVLNNDIFGAYGPANSSIMVVVPPTQGSSTVLTNASSTQAGNTIRYTPNPNYYGLDSMIYLICDSRGTCDTAVAYVWIGFDTDGDGVADEVDIDDDNDGITDFVEVCGTGATSFSCAPHQTDPSADDDFDGIVNYKDAKWSPVNSSGCSIFLDADGDGIPDYLDRDSDNDGIPDVVEALGVDANGDGIIDNYCDTDGDGLSQNVDANTTGAAGSGFGLGAPDFDADGVPNSKDLDSDNDGIPDIVESFGADLNNDGVVDVAVDSDGDGWVNQYDGDADGNGIVENMPGVLIPTGPDPGYVSCAVPGTGRPGCYSIKGNSDLQGYPNFIDLDSDGDGITDATESGITSATYSRGMVTGCTLQNGWCTDIRSLPALNLSNTDNHGKPNVYDIDSDNDGITDNVEAQPTSSYTLPVDTDTDGDGLTDAYDFYNGIGGNGLTPYDHDADGTPDYVDTDTDNDGAPDSSEGDKRNAGLAQATINASSDTDGDGLMDFFDIYDILSKSCSLGLMNGVMGNMGAAGSWNGLAPGGSNVALTMSVLTSTNRDWRNSTVLPLNIINFTATLQNKTAALVWLVQNEQQVDKYIVERSEDGIHFEAQGIRFSRNASSATYNFNDDLSAYTKTVVYYRIQQVNKSGAVFYTRIILFNLGKAKPVEIQSYPNPMVDQLTVVVPVLTKQEGTITLSDPSGKAVVIKHVTFEKGVNNIVLTDVARLPSGLYLLKVQTNEETFTQKVVK